MAQINQRGRSGRSAGAAERGFSLLEMLVVMAILVIVMSIVIPALTGARNSARKGATQSVMADVASAVAKFRLDESRAPGYFSPRELGSASNPGFTTMDNLILDLAGGDTPSPANPPQIITVSLGGATQVNVEVARIGSERTVKGVTTKGYLALDPKFFVPQNPPNRGALSALPAMVDAWGTPILAWQQDELPPTSAAPFASEDSGTRARFYRVSNKPFLESNKLGRMSTDQTDATTGSLLSNSGAFASRTMEALLGNPSFPVDANANPAVPAAARGPVVLHCAGSDGIYLGRTERGGKQAPATGVQYRANLDPIDGGAFNDFLVTAQ
jgi:prepilin-type N-terminal cleavage/methylation domain-containing protein